MDTNYGEKNFTKIAQSFRSGGVHASSEYLVLFIQKGIYKSTFTFINTGQMAEIGVGTQHDLLIEGPRRILWDGGVFKAVCRTALTNDLLLLVLQIGNLENYYHFYHSKTFKRSTLSSRGPHSFLRMDPQVQGTFPGRGLFWRVVFF